MQEVRTTLQPHLGEHLKRWIYLSSTLLVALFFFLRFSLSVNALPPEVPLGSPEIGVWLPAGVGLPKPVKYVPKASGGSTGGFNACSCVSAAKAWTGFNKSIGLAKFWPVTSQVPAVGAVVVFKGGVTGHVGLLYDITQETIKIREANFVACKVTTREIRKDDPRISGYWVN